MNQVDITIGILAFCFAVVSFFTTAIITKDGDIAMGVFFLVFFASAEGLDNFYNKYIKESKEKDS